MRTKDDGGSIFYLSEFSVLLSMPIVDKYLSINPTFTNIWKPCLPFWRFIIHWKRIYFSSLGFLQSYEKSFTLSNFFIELCKKTHYKTYFLER